MQTPIEDTSKMTLEELRAFQENLERQIQDRQARQRQETLDTILNIINDAGLEVRDVVAELNKRLPRRKAPALYRNPAQPRQTWSGKGKPPQWYIDAPDKEVLKIANEKRKL